MSTLNLGGGGDIWIPLAGGGGPQIWIPMAPPHPPPHLYESLAIAITVHLVPYMRPLADV